MANRSLFTITFSSSDSSSEEPPEEPIKPKPPTRLKPAVRRLSPRSNSPQPDPEPKPEPESEPEQPQSQMDEKQTEEESAKVANGDADAALEGDKPPPAAKVTYHVIRKTSRGLKGKRVHFQLVQDEQPLLHTKIKSDAPDTMFIAKGTDMHFSGSEFEGVILATSNMTSYSCRKGGLYGEEYATVKFSKRQGSEKQRLPRIMRATILERPKWMNGAKIGSRAPSRGALGTWTLDFGDRAVVPSIKNAILVDANDEEVCAIMKLNKGSLTITTYEGLDPLIVFTIGVSSFLCKLP